MLNVPWPKLIRHTHCETSTFTTDAYTCIDKCACALTFQRPIAHLHCRAKTSGSATHTMTENSSLFAESLLPRPGYSCHWISKDCGFFEIQHDIPTPIILYIILSYCSDCPPYPFGPVFFTPCCVFALSATFLLVIFASILKKKNLFSDIWTEVKNNLQICV